MAYQVELSRAARRAFLKLPPELRRRVAQHIDLLGKDPRPPGTTKLRGSDDLWRIRIGDYRIVYEIDDGILRVLAIAIAHRRDIYRGR